MPPKKSKPKDLLVLLVDVGSSSTHFEKVKSCAFNIYKGKLFKEKSLNEISLVIVGSEESENSENFDHISLALTPGVPTLANLKAIDNLQRSDTSGDWLQGLKVACDLVEESSMGQSYAKVGFILISSFESSVDQSLLSAVQDTVEDHSIDIICVRASKLNEHPSSQEALNKLESTSQVELTYVEETLRETVFPPKEEKRPTSWQVDFSIGDISIPITGYKWVGKEYAGNKWNVVQDDKGHIATSRVYTQKSDPDQAGLEEHEVVRGYHYGYTIIPMTSEEKNAMKYESGERGLRLICVTAKSNVPATLLQDDTVYVITASTKSKDNALLLSLIKQLHSENEVAIVRQVYCRNATPHLQVLYPIVEEDEGKTKYYFVMAHLPFAQQMNDIKVPDVMEFNNFVNNMPEGSYKAEQNALQSYLESLDLTKDAEYADDIPFLPEVTRNPAILVRQAFQIRKYLAPATDLSKAEIPAHIRELYEAPCRVHEVARALREQMSEHGEMLGEDNQDVKVKPEHGEMLGEDNQDVKVKPELA